MNAVLVRPIAQVDPGRTDSDIAAMVEDFLRAQLDPGSQLDPGVQLDPGYKVMAEIDSHLGRQCDPGQ